MAYAAHGYSDDNQLSHAFVRRMWMVPSRALVTRLKDSTLHVASSVRGTGVSRTLLTKKTTTTAVSHAAVGHSA